MKPHAPTPLRRPARFCAPALVLASLALLALPSPARAGTIAFDSSSSATVSTSSSSLSWTHSIGGGSFRVLVVGVAVKDGNSTDGNILGVSYNGTPMTLAPNTGTLVTGSGYLQTQLFYLLESGLPAAGSYTVTITFQGKADGVSAGAVSLTGVSQAAPERSGASTKATSSNTISTALSSVTPGAWIVDVAGIATGGSFTAGNAAQVERFDAASGSMCGAGSTLAATSGGTVTLGWTSTGSSRMAHSLAAFAPVPVTHELAVNTSGSGSVTVEPSTGTLVEGTSVRLTAIPDSGHQFTGWSGSLSGSDNPAVFTMDADRTITANFEPINSAALWRATHAAPFAGPAAGDGLLWRHDWSGATALWTMDGATAASAATLYDGGPWKAVRTADFNGDGNADLLWRNTDDGACAIWLMNGTGIVAAGGLYFAGSEWDVAFTPDCDGNGTADLLWHNSATGQDALWLMNGLSITGAAALNDGYTDWTVTAAGDLDGDGRGDLVWRRASDGAHAVWLMNGTTLRSAAAILSASDGWGIDRIADFNGDHKEDLLWIHDGDGAAAIWLMNGTGTLGAATIYGGGDGWSIAQAADFDGDGNADLLWRRASDGECVLWFMNGVAASPGGTLLTGAPDWMPVLTGDFNRDGRADLFWLHTRTGAQVIWLLNGASIAGAADLIPGFASNAYRLDITIDGSGSVSTAPDSIAGHYAAGTRVLLTPAPADGWIFEGWSGDIGGADNPASVAMDADRAVTALFTFIGAGDIIFIGPDGTDAATGADARHPTTLYSAVTRLDGQATGTILALPGTYCYGSRGTVKIGSINLSDSEQTNNGQSANPKRLFAWGGTPVFDFEQTTGTDNYRGIELYACYWEFRGITICRAGDNGLHVKGSHNTFDRCTFFGNYDSGLQISGHDPGSTPLHPLTYVVFPSYNTVINCDSFANYDTKTDGGNADGFAAKISIGPGNRFIGCVSSDNSDDGWDFFPKNDQGIYAVDLIDCIAWHNGYVRVKNADGTYQKNADGTYVYTVGVNGNGFKLGGDSSKGGAHFLTGCIAFDNKSKGFDQNHNPAGMTFINNTSYHNGYGDSSLRQNWMIDESPAHVFHNNLSYLGGATDELVGNWEDPTNCWWTGASSGSHTTTNTAGLNVTGDDFLSLDATQCLEPGDKGRFRRDSAGELILGTFLQLRDGSDLIDAGTPAGTDIGARESGGLEPATSP